MKRRSLLIATLFLIVLGGKGQEAAYRAPLDSIPTTGFYKIPIRPELGIHLNSDRQDLRLVHDGKKVPFILRKEKIREKDPSYVELDITERSRKKSTLSLIIEAPDTGFPEKLLFFTEKPDRSKTVRVQGSEKRKEWEPVMPETRIRSAVKDTVSSEFHIGGVFASDHRYYRLLVRDASGRAPKVITVGYYQKDHSHPSFYELPEPGIRQKEGEDKSFIDIEADSTRLVEKIELRMKGPPFFRRTARLGIPKGRTAELPYPYEDIGGGTFSQPVEELKQIEPRQSTHRILILEKGPDPPLKVQKVRLFQRKRAVIAHLEQGKDYELLLGGALKAAPDYELDRFSQRIPQDIPVLHAGKAVKIDKDQREWRALWIWAAIIVAALVLTAFSFRMVQERSEKKDP
ncbi:MAG: hypothetical protein ABEH38_03090 [Flavobacteriales bacterium]